MRLSDLDPSEVTPVPATPSPAPLRLSDLHPDEVTPAKAPSSYEGVSDDDLNWFQKLERKGVELGLVKPGMEMFSPKSLEAKKQALTTAANDVALGYLPQVVGAVKSRSVSSPDYIAARDEMAKELEDVPTGTKAVGHAIGMLPALALPAGAPGKTALGRVTMAAVTGAALGAVSNPGDNPGELDPVQAEARGKNALLGGALSAAPTALVEGAGAAANRFSEPAAGALDDLAEKRAVKQGGAMLKDVRGLQYRDRLNDTGRAMLDNGVVTPLASLEDVAERSGRVKEQQGKIIGAFEDALDSKFPEIARSPHAEHLFDPEKVAQQIEQELIEPMRNDPAKRHLIPMLEEEVQKFRTQWDPNERAYVPRERGPVPFSQASDWKRGYDEFLNWNKEQTPQRELVKRVRGILNGQIESSVDNLLQSLKTPGYDDWKKAKKLYGMMSDVHDMATDHILRNQANRFISPSDYGVGGVGALIGAMMKGGAIGGPAGAVAGAAANKFGRTYGSALAATGANALAKGARELPQLAGAFGRAVQDGELLPAMAGATAAREKRGSAVGPVDPERAVRRAQGTQYEAPLRAAAQRGNDSFASTYFLLSQSNPQFRQHMEEEDDQ